jgi:hypothetical protein
LGIGEQPFWNPATEMLHYTKTAHPSLSTITLETDTGFKGNIKYLIETSAELHLYCDGFDQLMAGRQTPSSLSSCQQYMIFAMQRLHEHPAMSAGNRTTSVYG